MIRFQYENARDFHEGLAEVMVADRWGYIYPDGTIAIEPIFRVTDQFIEGMASASPDGDAQNRYGFISKKGTFVVPPQYEMVSVFRHGLCFVKLENSVGYIDQQGRAVWQGGYVNAGRMSEL